MEIVDVDLFGRSDQFRFIRLGTSDFHVVSVILVNRVVAFTFTLCRFDPNHVFTLLTYVSCSSKKGSNTETDLSCEILSFPGVYHAL